MNNKYSLPKEFDLVKPLIASVVVFLLVLVTLLLVQKTELAIRQQSIQSIAAERVRQISSLLTSAMNVRLSLTNSLTAYVKTNIEFTVEDFDIYASTLKQDLSGIRSLQLAPGGIVTYLTDVKDNRAAMGHNLLQDPKRREVAEKSIRDKSYIIAGPLDLIQGGRAIIARRPIFLPDETSPNETFWGFATVLIDIDQLLEEASISKLSKDYDVSIRGKDGLGEQGDVFFGNEEVFERPITLSSIILPNASWQIAAALPEEFKVEGILLSKWFSIFAVLLSALAAGGTFSVVDRPRQLNRKVQAATLSLQNEVQHRKEAEEAIRYMAQHDLLTQLPNRYLFTELSDHMIETAKREETTLALLFIDLDGFKQVNDTFGHKSGDLLLKQAAERLTNIVRKSDLVARIGGDEFVILLSDTKGASGIEKVSQLVVKALSEDFNLETDIAKVSASVGIALYPDDAMDIRSLLHQADLAMYAIKNGKKSGYAFKRKI